MFGYTKYFISFFFGVGLSILPFNLFSQENNLSDIIPVKIGETVQKSVYTNELKEHGSFYNWAWGKHYRDVYYKPFTAKTASLIHSDLSIIHQRPMLHAFILEDGRRQLFLLRPLGGFSCFLESKFFREVYRHEDFKDTYLNDFITDAYTIIHPYMFMVSENLAKSANISSMDSHVYYMGENAYPDSILNDNYLKNRLVSISQLPQIKDRNVLKSVDTLMDSLHTGNAKIDERTYIKMRLFDMLIGDWNKVSENWYWTRSTNEDTISYIPQVIDRSHAFSKVDGFLFKELLGVSGVGFITNYEPYMKNLRKENKLALSLDVALTQNSTATEWIEEAQALKADLTDEIIDKAFLSLPEDMRNADVARLKENLKKRRQYLDATALKYYNILQKNPVVAATNKSERFVIDQGSDKELYIRVYDKETGQLIINKKYQPKYTKEIWLYGLGGDDSFEVNKGKRNIAVLLIGGEGNNDYNVEQGKNIFIYESDSAREKLKGISNAKIIIPNDKTALDYDYQKSRHTSFSVTPIGIYDSDMGLNLGTSMAYTIYGFRRAPYTRRHQLSYDLNNGFVYQGIFPSYDEKKSLHVMALLGSPSYFSNFFGFGNNTNGYKNEKNNYNRVNISKYMLKPSFYYNISKEQTFSISTSIEAYKVKNPKDRDRFINTFYDDDNSIYSSRYFVDLGATYELDKKMKHFISSVSLSVSSGWNVNLRNPERNFAYADGKFGINLKITDRVTFATLLKGRALFSNKYDFFQAATTELRGYRNNRFIGQKSFYQYSDIRLDMGKLENPFTPLDYGFFVGVDHGRVWYPENDSKMWHSSYGGGLWLTLLRKFTGKFSYFGSTDGSRFMFQLGMGF